MEEITKQELVNAYSKAVKMEVLDTRNYTHTVQFDTRDFLGDYTVIHLASRAYSPEAIRTALYLELLSIIDREK